MENFVMRHLRKGLMAASLSVALCLGGAVIASAQATTPQAPQPDPSQPTINPQSQSPSEAPASPSTSAPATAPDQDNGMRPAPNKDDQAQQPMSEQPPQDRDKGASSSSISAKDVKKFDKFLDSHKDIADDLQKDPTKVNDPSYVSSHKDLAKFLDDNPDIRAELQANPSKFMNREKKYEKHEDKHPDMQNPQSPQQ